MLNQNAFGDTIHLYNMTSAEILQIETLCTEIAMGAVYSSLG